MRLVMFAAMGAFLIASLCVPGAFGAEALGFAIAYAVARGAHIVLFLLASRDDGALRHSVNGLAVSTAIAVGLLFVAAFASGRYGSPSGALRSARRGRALSLRRGGVEARPRPLCRSSRRDRHHRSRRVDRRARRRSESASRRGRCAAAVLGVVVAAMLWWVYFDIAALVAGRQPGAAAEGRERNEIARDAYSYMHFPMVAGIGLLAVGLRQTLDHVDDARLDPGALPARRYGPLPARPRRLPLAPLPLAQPAAHPLRLLLFALLPLSTHSRARHARNPRGSPRRPGPLRGRALLRRPRARAPSGCAAVGFSAPDHDRGVHECAGEAG